MIQRVNSIHQNKCSLFTAHDQHQEELKSSQLNLKKKKKKSLIFFFGSVKNKIK